MIYFRDDLDETLELQIDSLKHVVNINHSLIEDNDGDESGSCHDVTIAGVCNKELIKGLQNVECNDLPTIRLRGDEPMLGCLAEIARVNIYHTNSNRLDTSLDFIRNYKSILMGNHNQWRLCAVWVCPQETIFGYSNDDSEVEYLCFKECFFSIELEVPCAKEESGNEPEDAYTKLFNMGSKREETTRVIIRQNLAEKSTEVWAGRLDGEYDRENLKPGQRMLSVSYDEDGDITLTRRYYDSDIDDNTLPKLLAPKDFGTIFCL